MHGAVGIVETPEQFGTECFFVEFDPCVSIADAELGGESGHDGYFSVDKWWSNLH